jgi:hypothetical protein
MATNVNRRISNQEHCVRAVCQLLSDEILSEKFQSVMMMKLQNKMDASGGPSVQKPSTLIQVNSRHT